MRHEGTGACGACRCQPPDCPDILLSLADITPLAIHRPKLGGQICRALGLDSNFHELPPRKTFQVGSWSADAVPVVLTIPNDCEDLLNVVSQLNTRLQRPFILLAPTGNRLSAPCQEMLAHARAGFFALQTSVFLTDVGTLRPAQTPGVLFARFSPQPDEAKENAVRQMFAMAKELDSDPALKVALPSVVLRLYCVDCLNATQIARKLRCHRGTVHSRLKLLRQKLGCDLAELRAYSGQFQDIEESLSDPRARRIYRKGAADGEEDSEES